MFFLFLSSWWYHGTHDMHSVCVTDFFYSDILILFFLACSLKNNQYIMVQRHIHTKRFKKDLYIQYILPNNSH